MGSVGSFGKLQWSHPANLPIDLSGYTLAWDLAHDPWRPYGFCRPFVRTADLTGPAPHRKATRVAHGLPDKLHSS